MLQTLEYPNDRLQILVVNNGSTDGTPQGRSHFGARAEVRWKMWDV